MADKIGPMSISTTEIVSNVVGDKAFLSSAADGSTLEVDATTNRMQMKDAGASLASGVQRAKMSKFAGARLQGSLTASDAGGGIANIVNSYGTDLVVERVFINVTTATGGACTADIGIGATTSSVYDTLIDGASLAATGLLDNADATDQGTNGKASGLWPNGQYLTMSVASGASVGLVGTYQILISDQN